MYLFESGFGSVLVIIAALSVVFYFIVPLLSRLVQNTESTDKNNGTRITRHKKEGVPKKIFQETNFFYL